MLQTQGYTTTYALRFSHGQTTGRESNTSRARQPQSGELKVIELILREQLLDLWHILLLNIRNEQMLVRRQPESALMDLGDFAESGLEVTTRFVLDTTVLDEGSKVVPAVFALVPAEVINVAIKGIRPVGAQLVTQKLLNLSLVYIESKAIDRVLETSILTTRIETSTGALKWWTRHLLNTVTMISLDEHDLLSDVLALLGCAETNKTSSTGVGLLVSMGHTHTTSNSDIEALKLAILAHNSDETQVVSEDINVVGGRNSNSNFELQDRH